VSRVKPGSYTAGVVDEPVRGGFPDPSFYSLPGIEQARAWLRGKAPRSPLSHLVGIRTTQVGSGTATLTLPASPWLGSFDGTLDVRILVQGALEFAALTSAPPASQVRTVSLALSNLRPCTVESENLVAKARTVNTGPTFTLAEVVVEDALGRSVAHGSATFVVRPIELPPPSASGPAAVGEPPIYPTPDPYQRPSPALPEEIDAMSWLHASLTGDHSSAPIQDLLGLRLLQVGEGTLSWSMPSSAWLCGPAPLVSPGVLACFAAHAHGAVATIMPVGHRFGVLHQSFDFLRSVPPDGHELLAQGTVTHQGDGLFIVNSEMTDADGNTVAVGRQTSLFILRRRRVPSGRGPERVLATVLFTDIVGSTEQAERLGDARWRELLEEHHEIIRKQIQVFKGKEVKTTGDGFLVTFDSPGRAVQAARAFRDGVRRLGLEVRAGLHTGECEMSGGDVAGIAVHLASRIQGLAGPGEILVSGTVHDLVTGSGLRFADRGRHKLKGIDGEWQLFALNG
jgi:class 3 adenylate cyclase